MGKNLESNQYKAGKSGATLAYSKAKLCRFATDIDGVRERSKWSQADHKYAVN